jgi:hypothetical protein
MSEDEAYIDRVLARKERFRQAQQKFYEDAESILQPVVELAKALQKEGAISSLEYPGDEPDQPLLVITVGKPDGDRVMRVRANYDWKMGADVGKWSIKIHTWTEDG